MSRLLDWLVENEPLFSKTRLPSLYSDLAVQKTTNPEGYAANVTAWQSALARAALAGQISPDQRLTLQSSEELLDALASPRYGRPSGLGLVLDEGVRQNRMLELRNFTSSENSIYHRTWLPSPWVAFKWGLRQAGLVGSNSYDESGRLRSGELVLLSALEDIAKGVVTLQKQKGSDVTGRIMTRGAFANELLQSSSVPLSTQDLDVLLQYLHRDKQLLSYGSDTIKLRLPNSSSPEPITKEDVTIASLKTLISKLEVQIAALSERVAALQSNAQTAVKNGNKQSALSALKSKKLAERTLQQRNDSLSQLEEIFSKIEQAVDQVQIVEVMQASAGVLRDLNKKVGGAERVEGIVDDLRDQMGKVDEVGRILEEPLGENAVLDEAEVDDELEAMEKEEAKIREEREAETTRERLEELDRVQAQAMSNMIDKQHEDDLRSSIERLSRVSLDDKKTANDKRERVPEANT